YTHEYLDAFDREGRASSRNLVAQSVQAVRSQRATAHHRHDRQGENRFHLRLLSSARTRTSPGSAASLRGPRRTTTSRDRQGRDGGRTSGWCAAPSAAARWDSTE